ncbi:MAG: DUF3368 domain-containing protein [Kiritimatiellia bacterium]
MAEPLVINTGPILTLAKIGALEIAEQLPYHFLTPEQVVEELEEGRKLGHPHSRPAWIEVHRLREPLRRFDTVTLGKGEAAVIQLALERSLTKVCIDEVKGRRVASTAGLSVVGVLGLLGRAKSLGLIHELKPYLQKAVEEGIRYDPKLVQRVLESVHEA